METDEISTKTVSSMITNSITMIVVEGPRLPQGMDHTCLGSRMTDALIVVGEGFQSTPGNRALMRDLFSFKVWLTGTGRIERAMTEITRLAAECMFQVQNVSAEPSEPQ